MEPEAISEPALDSNTSSPSSCSSPEKDIDYDDLPLLGEPHRSPSRSLSPPPLYRPYFYERRPSLYNYRFRFEEFLKPAHIGAGLWNMGNTCFLNSVLQCFTHTVPLLQSLVSNFHPNPCLRDLQGFCVVCALGEHVRRSLSSNGGIIEPYKFVANLSNLSSLFQRYQQEDAHEFLQCLVDKLDSCCVDPGTQVNNSSSQEDSFVKKIFGGRLKSQLKCCNCGHCSDTFEPLIDLSLEIEDVDTLPDALKSFTKVEKIEDSETKFTCEKCQKEVLLEKRFTVDQAPSVATFHLKRFKTDGIYVEKIDKFVEYPLELDLQPYTSTSSTDLDASLKYDLYAVIVHIGLSNSSGHYFCYTRSTEHAWYRMDDSKVIRVNKEEVLDQEAYLLFYARQGTPWFSNFYMDVQTHFTGFSTSPNSVLDNLYPIRTPSPRVSNIITDVEIRENRERVSIPSLGENKILGDVETREDEERISTPPPLGHYNYEAVKDGVSLEASPVKDEVSLDASPVKDEVSLDTPPLKDGVSLDTSPVKDGVSLDAPPVKDGAGLDASTVKDGVSLDPSPVKDGVSLDPSPVKDGAGLDASPVRDGVSLDASSVKDGVSLDASIMKDGVASLDASPKTPLPRSRIPDNIYSNEPPGGSYQIPRNHLKTPKELSRSSASKAMEESKRKEALRLTRSMPASRRDKFSACLGSPKSEGSLKRKKNKAELPFDLVGSTGVSPLNNSRRRLVGLQ